MPQTRKKFFFRAFFIIFQDLRTVEKPNKRYRIETIVLMLLQTSFISIELIKRSNNKLQINLSFVLQKHKPPTTMPNKDLYCTPCRSSKPANSEQLSANCYSSFWRESCKSIYICMCICTTGKTFTANNFFCRLFQLCF